MPNEVSPPIPKIVARVWAYFDIEVLSIVLNTSATIIVKLYDEHHAPIESIALLLAGEEYQLWTTDDYLISWTNEKLHNL